MKHLLLDNSGMSLVTPDIGLVFWTCLIFVILVVILGWFGFKPIVKAINERNSKIEDSLKQADKARAEMANLTAKNEEILKQAIEERSLMLKEAKETKDKIITEAKDQAKLEYQKIVDSAKADIENARKAAVTDLKNQMGVIVIDVTQQILKRELSNKTEQESYINKLISEANLN